jgi:hypothetical protein
MAVKRCQHCELGIAKQGNKFSFAVMTKSMTDDLGKQDTLRRAYKTEKCPICGGKLIGRKATRAG